MREDSPTEGRNEGDFSFKVKSNIQMCPLRLPAIYKNAFVRIWLVLHLCNRAFFIHIIMLSTVDDRFDVLHCYHRS